MIDCVRAVLLSCLLATGFLMSPARASVIRVPEDADTIQLALDRAHDGDTVLVSPGTYHGPIQLKTGVTLCSAGDATAGELGLKRAETTILDLQGAPGTGVEMAENSCLDGFTVTSAGVYDETVWQKHDATQGAHQEHTHIGVAGAAGVRVQSVNCRILNNIVHHCGYTGIAIEGNGEQTAAPCTPLVAHNVCYRNMGGGIGSLNGSRATISDNRCFENLYAGIGHSGASPTVIGNTCYRNVRAGIGISSGSQPVVRGNRCYKNRRAGIGIRTGADTRPLVENNACFENAMAGIGVEEHAAPVIRGNRCYRNHLAGIGARDHARVMLSENECFENERAGIGLSGDVQGTLVENHSHHNKAAGIGFEECESGRAMLVKNRLIENTLVAVGIHAGWRVLMQDNELQRTGGLPPLVMVFEGADLLMTGNSLRGSGVAGVRVAGSATLHTNRIDSPGMRPSGPPNNAVWALPGSQVTLQSNTFHNWRFALHATKSKVRALENTASGFHRTAFVVKAPAAPSVLIRNVAVSSDPDATVVDADGDGLIESNSLEEAATRKKD